MLSRILILLASTTLAACETLMLDEPKTLGEKNTGFNYIPVDPLLVDVRLDPAPDASTAGKQLSKQRYLSCLARRNNGDGTADLMDGLPDHTVRMAIRQLEGETNLSFGPVGFGYAGSAYQVVVDSGFTDTAVVRFAIKTSGVSAKSLSLLPATISDGTEIEVRRLDGDAKAEAGFEEVAMPIYVGIGLRLTANLTVNSGKVDLTNLSALAAKAEAKKVFGSLTVQTLGIYNQQVAATFPIPSELNQTTIQNAILSLGAVKAIVYDNDTGTRPRVTGIYNPLPSSDPKLVNRIYAALTSAPVVWRPCKTA